MGHLTKPLIQKILKYFCQVGLTVITILVGYPLIVIIFTPIWILRNMIEAIVTKLYPSFGSMLKGLTAILAAHSTYSKPTSVLITMPHLKDAIDLKTLTSKFNENAVQIRNRDGNLIYPELKQKIVRKFGYNFWYNTSNFDLSNHIKYLNQREPERIITQSEMQELKAQFGTTGFHPDRSPWEVLLVPRYEHETDPTIKCLIIARFHHCLADGQSLIKLMERLGVKNWKEPKLLPKNENKWKFFPKFIATLLRLLLEGPYTFWNIVLFNNDDNQWIKTVMKNPLNVSESQDTDPIHITILKKIKETSKHKLNVASIIIGLVAQAIHRGLERNDAKGTGDKIHFTLPWPRANHPGGLCNHWTMVKLPVVVDKNDAVKTAQNISTQFSRIIHSMEPLAFLVITNLIACLPTAWIPKSESLLRSTCILTNVAGPVKQVDIIGVQAQNIEVTGYVPLGYGIGMKF